MFRCIRIKRFMHQVGSSVRFRQHRKALANFLFIVRSDGPHNKGDWPDVSLFCMRTAYTVGIPALIIKRVLRGENKSSCILVKSVINAAVFQVRHRKQTGKICVVHQKIVSRAVCFIGINFTEFFMPDDCVLLNSGTDFFFYPRALCGKCHIAVDGVGNFSRFF